MICLLATQWTIYVAHSMLPAHCHHHRRRCRPVHSFAWRSTVPHRIALCFQSHFKINYASGGCFHAHYYWVGFFMSLEDLLLLLLLLFEAQTRFRNLCSRCMCFWGCIPVFGFRIDNFTFAHFFWSTLPNQQMKKRTLICSLTFNDTGNQSIRFRFCDVAI